MAELTPVANYTFTVNGVEVTTDEQGYYRIPKDADDALPDGQSK